MSSIIYINISISYYNYNYINNKIIIKILTCRGISRGHFFTLNIICLYLTLKLDNKYVPTG